MIAGYYLYNQDNAEVAKKLQRKTLKILLYAVIYFVLYAAYQILIGLVSDGVNGAIDALQTIFPSKITS